MNTSDIEKFLSRLHEKEYVLLTGNATTGIYLTLRALGLESKRIAIPNNVCINVPIAVKLSNNSPSYLDISKDTLGLSVDSLREKIKEIDAVIAVHSYGSTCAIKEIKEICKKNSIPVIEDFSVAQGAKIDNKPIGCFGDISITSFGAGKIIDSGHGGAILTNDRELFNEIMKTEDQLNIYSVKNSEKISQLNGFYKQLYNNHYGEDIINYIPDFQRKVEDTKKSFLFKFDEGFREIILNNLNGLKNNIEIRIKNSQEIKEIFNSYKCKEIKIFNPPNDSVYWRFNIFIENNRNKLLKYLLNKKYKISSWYPSVDIFFESRTKSKVDTPLSDWAGDAILNLWVNGEIDDLYINEITDEIVLFVEGNRDEGK